MNTLNEEIDDRQLNGQTDKQIDSVRDREGKRQRQTQREEDILLNNNYKSWVF